MQLAKGTDRAKCLHVISDNDIVAKSFFACLQHRAVITDAGTVGIE